MRASCAALMLLAGACAHAPIRSEPVPAEPVPAPVAVKPVEPTADELLSQGQRALQAGEYSEAREALTVVTERWPTGEIAGDAHYAIGESYFRQQKCREALFAFGRVMQEFPGSPSAPTAYLRAAVCFRLLDMPAEATLALEELKKQYAQNDAAQEADRLLAELKKKTRRGAKTVRR